MNCDGADGCNGYIGAGSDAAERSACQLARAENLDRRGVEHALPETIPDRARLDGLDRVGHARRHAVD